MKKAILIVLILSLFTACNKKTDTDNTESETSSSIISEQADTNTETALSETITSAESEEPLQPTPQEDELEAMLSDAFSDEGIFEYNTQDNEIYIKKYTGSGDEAVIPPTVNGLPVTKVFVDAFSDSSVTSLTVPGTVQKLNFVSKIKNLETLTFSSSPENFTPDNFFYLLSLKSIDIIGEGSYKSVDGVIYSGDGKTLVFCPRGKAGELVIPDGVEECAKKSFFHSDLTSVVVPESMTDISIFKNCQNLEKITVKGNISDFNSPNFLRCQKLKEINIEGSGDYFSKDGILYTDGGKTLVYCPTAKSGSFTVPDGVETIGANAFERSSLTEIVLPEGVKSIGSYAFSKAAVKELYLPDSIESIGTYIVNTNSEVKISAASFNDITSGIEAENISYRDETTDFKRAVRLAAAIDGKKILSDIDGDGFPELLVSEYPYSFYIYVYSDDSWTASTNMDMSDDGLELYYDSDKKCNVFFSTYSDSYYEPSTMKYYPVKNGFEPVAVGENYLYRAYYEDGINSSYAIVNEYEGYFNLYEYYKGKDIDYGGDFSDEAFEEYVKNYKLVRTVNLKELFESCDKNAVLYDGTFKDNSDRSAFPDPSKTELDIIPSDFNFYCTKFGKDEIAELSQNSGFVRLTLSGDEFDLDGIEKLDNIYEVVIEAKKVKNGEKLGEMKNLKALTVVDMNDIGFASSLKNINVMTALYYYSSDYNFTADYFEPLYKLENLHFLSTNIVSSYYYEDNDIYDVMYKLYSNLQENMPWLKICVNYY